jgi:preprotein translocase subunit Sec63
MVGIILPRVLQEWIVCGKIDSAAKQIDLDSILMEYPELKNRSPKLLCDILLGWLYPDHGFADQIGHGTKSDLSQEMQDRLFGKQLRFPDLQGAIRAP